MNDETTNKETPKPNTPIEADTTDYQKLKASNDEFEKELIRGRELKAESQKIEAEKMLSGESGGHVETVVKEETAKDYADKVMKGEKND
jgi:hypothetical protein